MYNSFVYEFFYINLITKTAIYLLVYLYNISFSLKLLYIYIYTYLLSAKYNLYSCYRNVRVTSQYKVNLFNICVENIF